jgi:hypothetical protein
MAFGCQHLVPSRLPFVLRQSFQVGAHRSINAPRSKPSDLQITPRSAINNDRMKKFIRLSSLSNVPRWVNRDAANSHAAICSSRRHERPFVEVRYAVSPHCPTKRLISPYLAAPSARTDFEIPTAKSNRLWTDDGVFVLDVSTVDKLNADEVEPIHNDWSGEDNRSGWGISLISLAWRSESSRRGPGISTRGGRVDTRRN